LKSSRGGTITSLSISGLNRQQRLITFRVLGKKKRRWGLKQVSIEFGILIAKVGAVFEKKELPRKPTRTQRTRVKKEVTTELARISKLDGQPRNIVADTISQIADKERRKAIRSGDWEKAIVASIIQYYSDEASKAPPSQSHWVS
jgi:hypothetical protein